MAHAFLSLLLVAVVRQAVHSLPYDVIEVTLVSEHNDDNSRHNSLDDFQELFDEFAEIQGIHFRKNNFRQIEAYISKKQMHYGMPIAKYGIRGIDCEQFRQFLSGIKAQEYHLLYASVKCGPITFSYCMAFSCDPGYVPSKVTQAPTTATTTTTTTTTATTPRISTTTTTKWFEKSTLTKMVSPASVTSSTVQKYTTIAPVRGTTAANTTFNSDAS